VTSQRVWGARQSARPVNRPGIRRDGCLFLSPAKLAMVVPTFHIPTELGRLLQVRLLQVYSTGNYRGPAYLIGELWVVNGTRT
jgi:hypothetical protein